ncbi:unnamed protein product [Effrenium voratum]|nr:unnamed protein product [Effrenium voratum]
MEGDAHGSDGRKCYRVLFTKERLRKHRVMQDGALVAMPGQGQVLSKWGEAVATVRLQHWDGLQPGERIEDLSVILTVVGPTTEEELWSGQAFLTPAVSGNQKSESDLLLTNEEAAKFGLEQPVALEAFVARKLRDHQAAGVRFMYAAISQNRGCILADTMGLGKSLQALSLLWAVLRSGAVRKAVVVCPSSLCGNWRAEVKKWIGERRLKPMTIECGGGREKVLGQLRNFRDFASQRLLIISYDMLRRHVEVVDDVCDLLICDEGHRLRSHGTATSKCLGNMRCQRRILLSGTPLQNDLEELFHCGRFVRPDLFPRSLAPLAAALRRAREPDATAAERQLGARAASELEHKTSQFLLRRTMENVSFTLPARLEVVLRLRMAPAQVAAYLALLGELRGGQMAKALKTMLALRLLCNDPADLIQDTAERGAKKRKPEDESDLAPPAVKEMLQNASGLSAKTLALLALLQHWRREAPEDRVVVVSNFARTLRRLQRLLPGRTALLAGNTAPQRRLAAVEALTNTPGPEGIDVLLLSSKAGGTGLNLIGANRLVLFDPDWNPANDAQAMARIWRDGQTKPCVIYRLVLAGTLEEKICQRQQVKTDLADITVDGQDLDGTTPRLSWDELRRVFALEGYAQGVPLPSLADASPFGAQLPPAAVPPVACLEAPELSKALLSVHVVSQTDGQDFQPEVEQGEDSHEMESNGAQCPENALAKAAVQPQIPKPPPAQPLWNPQIQPGLRAKQAHASQIPLQPQPQHVNRIPHQPLPQQQPRENQIAQQPQPHVNQIPLQPQQPYANQVAQPQQQQLRTNHIPQNPQQAQQPRASRIPQQLQHQQPHVNQIPQQPFVNQNPLQPQQSKLQRPRQQANQIQPQPRFAIQRPHPNSQVQPSPGTLQAWSSQTSPEAFAGVQRVEPQADANPELGKRRRKGRDPLSPAKPDAAKRKRCSARAGGEPGAKVQKAEAPAMPFLWCRFI